MANVTISDTLYHYTGFGGEGKSDLQAFETLIKILESSHLKLSRNEIVWGYGDDTGKKISGISFSPYITCFTETPVQFYGSHARAFGHFGIGFQIDWVMRNKGHNVVYVQDGMVNNLGDVISRMLTHLSIDKKSPEFPRRLMHHIVYVTENMNYRQEREWRIVGDKYGEIEFTFEDIDELVCKKEFESKLHQFIDSNLKYAVLRAKITTI